MTEVHHVIKFPNENYIKNNKTEETLNSSYTCNCTATGFHEQKARLLNNKIYKILTKLPYVNKVIQTLTIKGKSQEMPLPLCRAATVVGPARDGIQKKPSVRSPLIFKEKNN